MLAMSLHSDPSCSLDPSDIFEDVEKGMSVPFSRVESFLNGCNRLPFTR